MSKLGIIDHLTRVRERISDAARVAGRRYEDVTLIAVTKNVSADRVREAIAAGLRDLGENRVQEAVAKRDELGAIASACRWHLIGSLQTNKVKPALQAFDLIHSLDRPSLAHELAARAHVAGGATRVLVQVNVSGEESKHGLPPAEVEPFLESLEALESLRVEGLMTIAPLVDDPEKVRPLFRRMRELRDRLARRRWRHAELRELSMGMSGDYEVAVQEGATLVRVGTALFGPRASRA